MERENFSLSTGILFMNVELGKKIEVVRHAQFIKILIGFEVDFMEKGAKWSKKMMKNVSVG